MLVFVECVIWLFLLGFNFILCIVVLIGMLCIGNVLFILIGVEVFVWIVLLVDKFFGVKI